MTNLVGKGHPLRASQRTTAALLVLLTWHLLLPLGVWANPDDEAPASPLSAEVDDRKDQAIAEGLRLRFEQIDGLENVRATSAAGIVTLAGEVLQESDRETALTITRRIDGVAQVNDQLTVVTDPLERLGPAAEEALGKLQRLASYLPLLLISFALVGLFWMLSRWIGRWDGLFNRMSSNRFARDLLRQAIQLAVVLAGVLIALEILDATALVGAVLGTAGVIGLAVGFAFRDLVENYIASILLSIRQPFSPMDFVSIDDRQGKVMRLTSRATILMTLDGNHLRIPNSQVFKGVILNYSRNPRRRFDFGVGVGVGEDLLAAQDLGIGALAEMTGVLTDPGPTALVEELGDSNVLVRFYGWVDQREADFSKVKSAAIRRVKTVLEEAGMDLPEPIYRVHMVGAETAAQPEPPSARPTPEVAAAADDIDPHDPLAEQMAEDLAEPANGDNLLDSTSPAE